MVCKPIGGSLYRWDTDRQIKISKPDDDYNEIHFACSGDDVALVVEPNTYDGYIIANVPNILLCEHGDEVLYVYLVKDNTTMYRYSLMISDREKPSDYAYTETEIKSYEQYDNRLYQVEEKIKEFATSEQLDEVREKAETKEIFYAEYDVTPYEEIEEAYNAGKTVILKVVDEETERSAILHSKVINDGSNPYIRVLDPVGDIASDVFCFCSMTPVEDTTSPGGGTTAEVSIYTCCKIHDYEDTTAYMCMVRNEIPSASIAEYLQWQINEIIGIKVVNRSTFNFMQDAYKDGCYLIYPNVDVRYNNQTLFKTTSVIQAFLSSTDTLRELKIFDKLKINLFTGFKKENRVTTNYFTEYFMQVGNNQTVSGQKTFSAQPYITASQDNYEESSDKIPKMKWVIEAIKKKFLSIGIKQGYGTNSVIQNGGKTINVSSQNKLTQESIANGIQSVAMGGKRYDRLDSTGIAPGDANRANLADAEIDRGTTTANGNQSFALGASVHADGDFSHAEGVYTRASGKGSHTEGQYNWSDGNYSHTEGQFNFALGVDSHVEGYTNTARGNFSHVEGASNDTSGDNSHAEGNYTKAIGQSSHSECDHTRADGDFSHAEGHFTKATNVATHAEGENTEASGWNAHSEGNGTIASGYASHTEGNGTIASGSASHSEGGNTKAIGDLSHAEGNETEATGNIAHAEGYNTKANGNGSHSEGACTHANGEYQHVQGKFNVEDNQNKYAHIVGGGTSENDRKNIHTIDWLGNAEFSGNVKSNNRLLATEEYVNNADYNMWNHMEELTNRINSALDSDDTTLDQLSEIVAYVKSNKDLIDAVTTSKINVSDIVDNLITTSSNKPLSAFQGTVLKEMIDNIFVPTKVSELDNDEGYVKNTEYANRNQYGLLKFDAYSHATQTTGDGFRLVQATEQELKNIEKYESQFAPITAYNLPLGVKIALAYCQLQGANAWTEEEKTSARELLGAVGNEDYATLNTAGIIKVGDGLGVGQNGYINIDYAGKQNIESKNDYRRPIVPAMLDYSVKKALADCKLTGTDIWTEEEKASVRDLLGVNDIKTIEPDGDGEYSIRILEQEAGLYKIPLGTKIYPYGLGDYNFTSSFDTIMIIVVREDGERMWFLFERYSIRFGVTTDDSYAQSNLPINALVVSSTTQAITGQKTFSTTPKLTGTIVSDTDIVNKQYVDSKTEDNWELINEITVEEDCNAVYFNQDLNGNNFSLKKMIIDVTLKPNEGDYTTNLVFNAISRLDWGDDVIRTNSSGIKKSIENSTYFRTIYSIENGVMCPIAKTLWKSGNSSSISNTMYSENTGGNAFNSYLDISRFEQYNQPYTQVCVGSYQPIMGAGTVVKVYGVRG